MNEKTIPTITLVGANIDEVKAYERHNTPPCEACERHNTPRGLRVQSDLNELTEIIQETYGTFVPQGDRAEGFWWVRIDDEPSMRVLWFFGDSLMSHDPRCGGEFVAMKERVSEWGTYVGTEPQWRP